MRILAHIHTLNDEDVIRTSLLAVLSQTRSVDHVLIVDNGSTDGTLDIEFPQNTTIIRNAENIGTSGAVCVGLRYGLEHDFDWVWTFDADSAPRPDALAKLLELYNEFTEEQRQRTACLASLPINIHDGRPRHGLLILPGKYAEIHESENCPWYRCDVTIWSGTLFRMAAVREIGIPSADYVLDWGEFEYGYRIGRAGYNSYINSCSIIDHDIGGAPSAMFKDRRIGVIKIPVLHLPPIRAYYYVRNNLHFWLHEYRGDQRFLVGIIRLYKCSKLIANAFLVEHDRMEMLWACVRGYWDGLLGRIGNRYRALRLHT